MFGSREGDSCVICIVGTDIHMLGFEETCGFRSSGAVFAPGTWMWAVQAGLLTPLTSVRHRLSPLAAFTSGAYFLHNGRR